MDDRQVSAPAQTPDELRSFRQLRVPEDFATLAEAVTAAHAADVGHGGFLSISLAPGRYGSPERPLQTVEITRPDGALCLEVVGRTGRPEDVVLVFDASANRCGFLLERGAGLYKLAFLTLIGQGGWLSHGLWRSECFGAGVLAAGGSRIGFLDGLRIQRFYYGVKARECGVIYCTPDVEVADAGDVGFHAWRGGVIICSGAKAFRCKHGPQLGGGFCAEDASFLDCQGALAEGCNIAGFTSTTSSSMAAQNSCSRDNDRDGYFSNVSSSLLADGAEARRNGRHGFYAFNAFVGGNRALAERNGGSGFHAERHGAMDVTVARSARNQGDGFAAVFHGTMSGNRAYAEANGGSGFSALGLSLISGEDLVSRANHGFGLAAEFNGAVLAAGARCLENRRGSYGPSRRRAPDPSGTIAT